MKTTLEVREGLVGCPRRGPTSVAVCCECRDVERVEDSGVVCKASYAAAAVHLDTVLMAGGLPFCVGRARS
jgi:hypothetical protein